MVTSLEQVVQEMKTILNGVSDRIKTEAIQKIIWHYEMCRNCLDIDCRGYCVDSVLE